MPITQIKKINNILFRAQSSLHKELNTTLLHAFLKLHNEPGIRKTHLFDDRYENIYLNEKHIPELELLINQATKIAEDILQTHNLRAGYWFNYMPPDTSTTLHTHDDDDELLSAVYYVYATENSGNLIIYDDSKKPAEKIEIVPKAGNFVFFKPDVRHEVSRNNSTEHRLSIGINFGMDS